MTRRYHMGITTNDLAPSWRINRRLAQLDSELVNLRDGAWEWMNRTAAPVAPTSGYRLYFLNDYLYRMDNAGVSNRIDVYASVAHLADVKASGTGGGASSNPKAWHTRDLNTIISDDDGIITALAANQFTLEVGTYTFRAWAPSWGILENQLGLYDTTAAAFITHGVNSYSRSAEGSQSFCVGEFTLAIQSVLELQMLSDAGLGADVKNFGYPASITDEVYAQILIWKQL
jgi:hypothetical protein